MKKNVLINYKLLAMLIVATGFNAQIAEAQTKTVKQAVFTTGGNFGTLNNKVKFYSYDPVAKTKTVRDAILGDFSNDIVTDSIFAYVHIGRISTNPVGKDIIVKYNLNDYSKVDSVSNIAGAGKLFVNKNMLIVAKGYGATSNYVEIFNTNNLKGAAIYSGTDFPVTTSGITVLRDTAYVSYTENNFGKLGIISLTGGTPTFVRTQVLDTLAKGISSLFNDGTSIYGLAKNNDFPAPNYTEVIYYAGVTVFDPKTKAFNSVQTTTAGGGIDLQNGFLYANFSNGLGKFNTTTKIVNNNPMFVKKYTAAALDAVNDRFYLQQTDYSSKGSLIITDFSGTKLDSIDTDISGSAIALDIRTSPLGVDIVSSQIEVKVFPNPTMEILNIEIPENSKSASIFVYDISGKVMVNKVITGVTNQINVSELTNGIYFLSIKGEIVNINTKFIKQ